MSVSRGSESLSVDDEPPLVAIKLVIAATLLLFEAIFAAAEIGLLGASRIRIKHLAAEGDRRAKLVERLRANPTRMVATVLIAITALLYFSEALATHSALELSAPWLHWLVPVLFLIGALIFCELTPILYASIHPERTAIFCAPFVLVVQWVFAPVLWVIGHVTALILRLLHCDPEAKPPLITEGEMAAILETAERDGVLESEERQMLLGALEFTDFHVSEVMIPKAPEKPGLIGGNTPITKGLGLVPEVIVDQHFMARHRMDRLLSAVMDHQDRIGVGIGEATAIVVRGDNFTVMGEGSA